MVPTGTYILHIPPCILQICREMGMAGEEQKSFVLYPSAVVRALQCNDLTHVKTNSKQMAPKNHLNSQDSILRAGTSENTPALTGAEILALVLEFTAWL